MAKSAVTAERFAKGMTFDEYVKYAGSPENLAREAFGGYFPDGGSIAAPAQGQQRGVPRALRRGAPQRASRPPPIKWLAAQPGGPAKILVISEDWSSDCRRDVPVARAARRGGRDWSCASSIATARRSSARDAPIPPPLPTPTTT